MKEIDFERYLQDIHAKEYTGTDDDMFDAFNEWLEEISTDEICKWANEYARDKVCEVIDDMSNKLREASNG